MAGLEWCSAAYCAIRNIESVDASSTRPYPRQLGQHMVLSLPSAAERRRVAGNKGNQGSTRCGPCLGFGL
jgi:hypothetical protein